MTSASGWLNTFLQEQQQINAARDTQYQYNPVTQAVTSAMVKPTVGDYLAAPSSNIKPMALQDVSGGPSILDRTLDVLMRPLYGAANLATNAVDEIRGINPEKHAVQAVASGLSGVDKKTYIDVAKAAGLNGPLADIIGTAGNIFLDPANLVYGPLGGAAVKGLKGLTGSLKAGEDAAKFRDLSAANFPDFNKPDVATTPAGTRVTGVGEPNLIPEERGIAAAPDITLPDTTGNAIGAGPRFAAGPDGTVTTLARNNVAKDAIDQAIHGVNSRAYNIGNISSPYDKIGETIAADAPAAGSKLPDGLTFTTDVTTAEHPRHGPYPSITRAYINKEFAGELRFYPKGSTFTGIAPGEIGDILVLGPYQRQGIASAMIDEASKASGVPIYHSNNLSTEGKKFVKGTPEYKAPSGYYQQWYRHIDSGAAKEDFTYKKMRDDLNVARRNPTLQKDFAERYKNILDPKDYAALQRVRSPKVFDEVAANILAKTQPAGYKSVSEFVNAAKHGEVPEAEIKKVLDSSYADNLDELVARYNAAGGDHTKPLGAPAADNAATVDPKSLLDQVLLDPNSTDAEIAAAQQAVKEAGPTLNDQVRANAQAPEPASMADAVAQEAAHQNVIKNGGKKIDVGTQGRNIQDKSIAYLKRAKQQEGIYRPGQHVGMAAGDLYRDVATADTINTAKGIAHPVSAVDHAGQMESAKIVPALQYKHLRAYDVMQVLGLPQVGKAFVNFKTKVIPSVVLRMAARALDAHHAGLGSFEAARLAEETGRYWNAKMGIGYKNGRRAVDVENQINQTATLLGKNVERLAERMDSAGQEYDAAIAHSAGNVVKDVETDLAHSLSDSTGSTAEAVEDLSDIGKMTKDAAGGNEDVAAAAGPTIAEDVGKVTNESDVRAAKTAKENADSYKTKPEDKAQKDAQRNGTRQAKADMKDAEENLIGVMPDGLTSYEEADIKAAAQLNQIAEKIYHKIGSLFATFGRKGREIAASAVAGIAGGVTAMKDFDNLLYNEMKQFTPDNVRTAFHHLQIGEWPEASTEAFQATKALRKYLDSAGVDTSHMKGIEGDSLKGSMWGNQFTTDDIHRAMREAGMPDEHIIPAEARFEKLRKDNNYTLNNRQLMSQAWRHVDVENPVDFVARLNGAYRSLSMESALGAHFTNSFASSVRHPGWIRLSEDLNVAGGSRYWQYIDKVDGAGKPIYYPPEAAEWMAHTENIVAAMSGMTKASGPIANFFKNYYDPLMAVWKTTVTVARPGFITRNFTGDTMINTLLGIHGIKAYKDGLQIMKAGGRLKDRTIEAMDKLLREPSDITEVGKWNATVHLKSGKARVSDQQLAAMAYQQGVMPSFRQTADVMAGRAAGRGGGQGFQPFAEKIMGSGPAQFASRVSEETSHIPRMAQFAHHMQDPKFTGKFHTVEEAAQAAANNVRKYHPDVTGLSPSGQKYLRRVYPFYSWTRLVTPIVLEHLLTRPTSITAYPKVLYGANQLMGGGAASPSELYPPTRLLPSYVRDTLGYIGGNASFNLGTPVESLADTFNGNPARNLLFGMANPMIQGAIDLPSGIRHSTGAGIADKSDYIDQMLPIVNQLSNLTGVSVSGSLASLVTGNAPIEPQRAVQIGEKNFVFNQSLFNFLTGIGYSNFNRPSYQNIATNQYRGG